MNAFHSAQWYEANQARLMQAIATVRQSLERALGQDSPHLPTVSATSLTPPAAIDRLCTLFQLTPFERDLLLLCVGVELDAEMGTLCAALQGDSQRTYPTFNLALAALSQPHWAAITPQAPLRRWQLIEVGAGKTLTMSPLRIDERILHYLTGIQHLDERLMGLVKPVQLSSAIVPSHQELAEQITTLWAAQIGPSAPPIVQLCGDDGAAKLAIAATACTQLNLNLHLLSPTALPTSPNELLTFLRLWEREARLSDRVLLLSSDDLDSTDAARETALCRLIEDFNSPLILTNRDRRRPQQRPFVTFDIPAPTPREQLLLWQTALGDLAPSLNGHLAALVSQFNLSATTIHTICTDPRLSPSPSLPLSPPPLWHLCRTQARPRLDDLAQRIDSHSTWDDLVLPAAQKQVLKEVAAHVRQRAKVYETWGFAGKSGRGLGISALFAGASGTGKTMAADVLAQELQLDLYRIDLSSIVSKYIGETEKNLRRVFDAAEAGGVILLFDEADALFGKRSEVKDSHDRYANMEVSYLLQRMEAYRGLAILTTNLKDALDVAFLRRLRFVVKFPFPDAAQRAEIWRRIFPQQTPTEGLDVNKLARLNVAGGNIRNIALNAAFLAAEASEPVRMKHLLIAAQSEYIKLERTLTESEVRGWN